MKTAMQQLIDKLSDFKKELSDKYDADPYVTKGVSIAIGEANKLLEEEKRQIEKAFLMGQSQILEIINKYQPITKTMKTVYKVINDPSENENGIEYYNQTYNNENKQDTIQ